MELSFSRFRIHAECPWKYKLQFVEGRKIAPTPQSSLGLSLHRALERYHREGQPELEHLLDAFDLEFLRSGYPDAETKMKWHKKGRRILEKYYESELQRRTEIVGAEKEFVFELGRHTVRGMIDRVDRRPDGSIELVDYKTSFGLDPRDPAPSPKESDLQMRFYALGAKLGLGLEPKHLTVHYLAAGMIDSRPYDGKGEDALKRRLVQTADDIEAGRFGPDVTFCPRCGFRKECSFSTAK